MRAALEEGALADESVITQIVSVVGSKQDHRVLQHAALFERGQDSADLVVDLLHQGRVMGADFSLVGLRELCVVDPIPRQLVTGDIGPPQPRMLAFDFGRGCWHVGLVELPQIIGRRVVGTVRPRNSDHHRLWYVALVLAQVLCRLLSDEVVPVELPRQQADDGAAVFLVAFVLVAVVLAVTVRGQKPEIVVFDQQPAFVLGDDAVGEAQTQIPGIEVHLADGSGVIAGSGQSFGPGVYPAVGIVWPQKRSVRPNAGLDRVHARQQRYPGSDAQGMLAVGIGVAHASSGDAIDVGGGDEIGTVTAEEIVPQLVGHDEDDVGSF